MPERGKKRGVRAESPSRREAAEARTPLWREARTPVRPDGGRSGLALPAGAREQTLELGSTLASYWLLWLLAAMAGTRVRPWLEGSGPPQARRGLRPRVPKRPQSQEARTAVWGQSLPRPHRQSSRAPGSGVVCIQGT